MTIEEKYKKIIEYFQIYQPVAQTELHYRNPYELIVAVILSAQCTDKRVNLITPEFFKFFPSPKELYNSNVETIFDLIKSCSFPNNKAKHLHGMSKILVEEFNCIIPSDIEKLEI